MKTPGYIEKIRAGSRPLWKRRKPLLQSLDIELTERCNNNCIHCCINLPGDDPDATRKELSTQDWKEVLKEAVSLGCLSVRLTGGEPLLREDFADIYLFARKLGLKVLIFTNATLITEPLAKLFSRIPPLNVMEVSVYGMKRESYEAVTRSPGSYDAMREGIRRLRENKIPFAVKNALLPPNKDECQAFDEWAMQLPGYDGPPPYSLFFDLRCRRDSEEKNAAIRRFRAAPEAGVSFLANRSDDYATGMNQFCTKFMGATGSRLFSCGAGLECGCVDPYGVLFPCLLLQSENLGYNPCEGSLKEAFTIFFPQIRRMEAANPLYLSRCAGCALKGLCEQCPAKSWMEHGTLDSPVEYCCRIAHEQASLLGLLKNGETGWSARHE